MKIRYICCNCGKMFDKLDYIQEYMGEFWGTPAYDWFPVSPCCGDDYEEVADVDRGTTESTEEV